MSNNRTKFGVYEDGNDVPKDDAPKFVFVSKKVKVGQAGDNFNGTINISGKPKKKSGLTIHSLGDNANAEVNMNYGDDESTQPVPPVTTNANNVTPDTAMQDIDQAEDFPASFNNNATPQSSSFEETNPAFNLNEMHKALPKVNSVSSLSAHQQTKSETIVIDNYGFMGNIGDWGKVTYNGPVPQNFGQATITKTETDTQKLTHISNDSDSDSLLLNVGNYGDVTINDTNAKNNENEKSYFQIYKHSDYYTVIDTRTNTKQRINNTQEIIDLKASLRWAREKRPNMITDIEKQLKEIVIKEAEKLIQARPDLNNNNFNPANCSSSMFAQTGKGNASAPASYNPNYRGPAGRR